MILVFVLIVVIALLAFCCTSSYATDIPLLDTPLSMFTYRQVDFTVDPEGMWLGSNMEFSAILYDTVQHALLFDH